ncbi:nitrilase-related carbon-nitrogen hydrolase [Streptacidiphilus monticola]
MCFESAFPDMSRALAERGAQLLLVQSATSSYQDTWAPAQHASLAALRAAETGRPVVQATLTGVSTAYDATGRRIGAPLGTDRSDTAVYTVPLASGRTLYDRWGNWLPAASVALVLLWGLGWAGVNLRNRRH